MSRSSSLVEALHDARAAEKDQASYYRALAGQAEAADRAELAERLNGLHADEQHHLSRLSARLVELGEPLEELRGIAPAVPPLERWEADAKRRERAEVARYESLLRLDADERTATMLREFLDAERHHEAMLGGKWMQA